MQIAPEQLVDLGLDPHRASLTAEAIDAAMVHGPAPTRWMELTRHVLTPDLPFSLHQQLFRHAYHDWNPNDGPPPAWIPDEFEIERAHVTSLAHEYGLASFEELRRWSIEHRDLFWGALLGRLQIRYQSPPRTILADADDPRQPRWLPGAKLNISDSCFVAPPDRVAIISGRAGEALRTTTYAELYELTNRVANGLVAAGFRKGDAIGLMLPMSVESIGLYLGIVKAGCIAVSIADSFAAPEIAKRLAIAGAQAIFIQDVILRDGKQLALYDKLHEFDAPRAIVLTAQDAPAVTLRSDDLLFSGFLSANTIFDSVRCAPDDVTNLLFSSGTTGNPKAIPWTHTTPIKCAADGHLHHDLQSDDISAWPTNLGWMMGPWLIYSGLINAGSIALYLDSPTGSGFCRFVQDAHVTMLGVVPSLVSAWRKQNAIDGSDWLRIRAFSSTGECSNPDDMLFLMSRAGYRPVIEYCGGTEIGGGYLTGTVVQPNAPATFSTPALGLDIRILDEAGDPARQGEVFLVPPSIGLSTELLNSDHDDVYYQDTPVTDDCPVLRRHGDEIEQLPGGYYRAHGRTDDTMNLGGIKVSSVEMERCLNTMEGVAETAAIAVPPSASGPDELVVYAVLSPDCSATADSLLDPMRERIRSQLNPLFKIQRVVIIDSLPRTASNKVMRRVLRQRAQDSGAGES